MNMKILLKQQVYKDLIYEANTQGMASAALVAKIIEQYLSSMSHQVTNLKEDKNYEKESPRSQQF